jgi:hypothetical protein
MSVLIGGFIITNNETGEGFQDALATPVYSIKWSPDSETVVLIVHIAGGSVADIYTLRNNKWIWYGPEPTVGDHCTVIRQDVGNDTVKLTYKVGDKAAGRFYLYSFVFHPDTAARSDVRIHEIDIETYRKLQFKGEQGAADAQCNSRRTQGWQSLCPLQQTVRAA